MHHSGVGRTRKTTCKDTRDVPTVGAVKQIDTVEQCGEFEESFHLGPTGFQEAGDSGCHAQKVYATVPYKECAEGGGGIAVASAASSLDTPGPQEVATDAGTACHAPAMDFVTAAQMATQVAQFLAELVTQSKASRQVR